MATKLRALFLAIALGLCLIPSTLRGADPAVIQSPPTTLHHFMDAQNIGAFSLNAIMMAADLATTRRALQVPGTHEENPLMRSQGVAIVMKVGVVGAGIGIAYMLHKTGHHRAERLLPIFMGMPSAIAAAHNAGIHP
jgi:hypothetical protein